MTSRKRLFLPLLATIFLLQALALPRDNHPVPPAGTSVCGTSLERTRDALARAKYQESLRQSRALAGGRSTLATAKAFPVMLDIGDVTVMEDDGTIISNPNPFDLAGTSFRFEPSGSSAYLVVATNTSFDATGSTPITLADDATFNLSLQPPFSFYGQSYASIQVNSDGNLTFLQADISISDRNLGRFSSGPPRIGPFFTDLDPSKAGTVSYRNDSDGVLIAWNGVAAWSSGAPVEFNSFSVKLYQTGNIEFVYATRVDTQNAIVGISPGNGQGGISAVSFAASSLPTQPLGGTIAEVFATQAVVSESTVARKFLQTHPDVFDHLNLFLGFPFDLGGGAYAYELPVKNEILGIGEIMPGQPTFDFSADYGSNGRLRSFLNMGTLSGVVNGFPRYPADPNKIFFNGTNSTMGIMGQESGHRWEAFAHFMDGSVDSDELLGRDLAHWSFFFNSEGSVMEGNQIQDTGADKGNSRFLTTNATYTYSKLDEYIMGLLPPEAVPPMFVVSNPSGTSGINRASPPQIGVSFGGTRKDFTVDSIIAANGPRVPSAYQAPKVFRQAFIYLVQKGQAANPVEIAKVQRIRDAWVKFFNDQTGQRGWIVTDLQDSPATTPTQIYFPYFQQAANRYTGVAVANWGATPADVLLTAYDNTGTPLSRPGTIINPRMITVPPGAQVAAVAEQLLGISLEDPHNGWLEAESTSSKLRGFFLDGDSAQTMLSGAVAGNQAGTSLYFMRAQISSTSRPGNSYRNLINVVNPDPSRTAQLSLTFYDESGIPRGNSVRTLSPRGRLSEDLTGLIPGLAPPIDNGYLKMTSSTSVVGYQSIDTGTTIFALPAVPSSTASILYSAQFASGLAGPNRYFSELNLINTGDQARTVQIRLVGNDGNPVAGIRNPVNVPLAAGQQYRAMGESIFGLTDPKQATNLVDGSVVINADGPGIIGDVTFGDPVAGRFLASLPLDGNLVGNLVFSQVAQGSAGGGKPYFTGVAMFNPGISTVSATLDVYSSSGVKTGSAIVSLPSGHRLSKTLDELVPGAQGQIGGYIRITATGGTIISFGLFGTQSLDFLAAIPAQSVDP